MRVDQRFLERLDAQLGEQRGPNGTPSRIDFLRFELPAIEDDFALRFEQLSEVVPGRPDYRIVTTAGRLVPGIAIEWPSGAPREATEVAGETGQPCPQLDEGIVWCGVCGCGASADASWSPRVGVRGLFTTQYVGKVMSSVASKGGQSRGEARHSAWLGDSPLP